MTIVAGAGLGCSVAAFVFAGTGRAAAGAGRDITIGRAITTAASAVTENNSAKSIVYFISSPHRCKPYL
jgi:hypothetical protein